LCRTKGEVPHIKGVLKWLQKIGVVRFTTPRGDRMGGSRDVLDYRRTLPE